jgi:hypothetical protein
MKQKVYFPPDKNHRTPFVTELIDMSITKQVLRFNGYFYENDLKPDTVYKMNYYNKKGKRHEFNVHFIKREMGPSTNNYTGLPGSEMEIERILDAARSSKPFEPINVPPAPPEELQQLKQDAQDRKEVIERAKLLPNYDPDDYLDICFFPSNVIDIRFDFCN